MIGADRTRYIPHFKVERHLEQLGLSYTFLRAGFFTQNLGDLLGRAPTSLATYIRDHADLWMR